MKQIKNYLFALMFATTVGGAVMATVPTATASAADCRGTNKLLTLPSWYRGLAVDDGGSCRIKSPNEAGGLPNFIWTIVLNILDMMLQIVGYIAAGFMIYGGFMYLTSGGSADSAAKARKTILNAAIGIVLAVASVALVNMVARGLNIS